MGAFAEKVARPNASHVTTECEADVIPTRGKASHTKLKFVWVRERSRVTSGNRCCRSWQKTCWRFFVRRRPSSTAGGQSWEAMCTSNQGLHVGSTPMASRTQHLALCVTFPESY